MTFNRKTYKYWQLLCCILFINPLAYGANWVDGYFQNVEKAAKKVKLPGVAIVAITPHHSPQFFTYGRTHSKGQAIDEDTRFRLASVSKTFTAALMAKEVQAKQVSWHTQLSEMSQGYFKNSDLNLRHLLSQSSGFMPNAYDNLIEANYALPRVLKALDELSPICAPGKCYTYQNALFGVIEQHFQANQSSYGHSLKQRLLTPLNMTRSNVGLKGLTQDENWARPNVAIKRNKWRQGRVNQAYYRFSPAAGVNASIHDMGIWLQAMLGQYSDVLDNHNIEQITQPQIKTKKELRRKSWRGHLNDASYALGWRVYDFEQHTLIYHGGWVKGYRADIAFSPETQTGLVVLMNAEANQINQFSVDFWQAVFANNTSEAMQMAD